MIRIGTRGSRLALWQAEHVAAALRSRQIEVEIIVLRTTGDRVQDKPLPAIGIKGMFTAEIELALRDGRIDLAVHSLKDLPTELAPEFSLAAIPPRESALDVLLSPADVTLATLPQNARVGTSSLRRQGQVLYQRTDLEVVSLRGNVDTRLRKLAAGEMDAIILAAAGVDRLGLTEMLREELPPSICCPCPGQGALALEVRSGDAATYEAVGFLDHPETRYCVDVERRALARLGGGCSVPIGVYCAPGLDGLYRIFAAVCSPNGRALVRIEHSGMGDATHLATEIVHQLNAAGADDILRNYMSSQPSQ
jgi:hydroxymethylbilane synthase